MRIDDDELRTIFQIASEEHLQKLDDGLLHLEKHPDDGSCLAALMRDAHSLKGDAGMVGVKDVATLAHQIESILGEVKQGKTPLSRELSDRLSQGLDTIRKLVHEAVTGEAAGVNPFQALANLMGAATSGSNDRVQNADKIDGTDTANLPAKAETASTKTVLPETIPSETIRAETLPSETVLPEIVAPEPATTARGTNPTPSPLMDSNLPAPVAAAKPQVEQSGQALPLSSTIAPKEGTVPSIKQDAQSGYRIETIRVGTRNLDALMTQAGELTVTKIRIAQHLTELDTMVALWEDWSRDAFLNRFLLNELSAQNGQAPSSHVRNSSIQHLQRFHERAEARLEQFGTLVSNLKNQVYEDITRLDIVADELESGIRTLRLLPLSTIFQLFPRLVRDLARSQNKAVDLVINGGETLADKRILEQMKDPLTHLIRNAIDHGIETPEERERSGKPPTATLLLQASQSATGIIIEVADDGRGLALDRIQQTALQHGLVQAEELAAMSSNQIQSLIFSPGFSTRDFVTEVSGRGVGLDVVRLHVEELKGTIQVQSTPHKGCRFCIQLGTTLTTAHVLLVAVHKTTYALPVEAVRLTKLISQHDIFTLEGRDTIAIDNQPISLVSLADLLELSSELSGQSVPVNQQLSCIILKIGEEQLGLIVDALLDEQDVLLKPQSKLLKRVRNISGATILGTGDVCMVLNPQDLLASAAKQARGTAHTQLESRRKRRPTILLVEDSIATRTQEKRILTGAGYDVVTAVDGLDGLRKLRMGSFDAVISDVQMPNLDGLTLTTQIRSDKSYSELPIVLVTSLETEDDRRRGAEAGANAYITKGAFNQEVLLKTLKRLV